MLSFGNLMRSMTPNGTLPYVEHIPRRCVYVSVSSEMTSMHVAQVNWQADDFTTDGTLVNGVCTRINYRNQSINVHTIALH